MTADDQPLKTVQEALASGDLFGAYDAASRAIMDGHDNEEMRHSQALALARMGDTERALGLFRAYGLDRSRKSHRRALGARLLKDEALATGDREDLKAAYQAYRTIFDKDRDSYPGINAASLALLAGEADVARDLAKRILRLKKVKEPGDYYCAATRAEAFVNHGDAGGASDAQELANTLPGANGGARAGTLRQLAIVAPAAGLPASAQECLLRLLRPPATFHYAGHMFVPDAAHEQRILAEVEAALAERNGGYAFGSIAAGADVLVAEAVLRRGGELNIVLPCAMPDFFAQSVRPAGEAWVKRAEACLAGARSVVYASQLEYVSDPTLFGYGSAVAMGLARLRAQHLSTDSFQLAIWDRQEGGPVGTGADVRLWQRRGGDTHVIDAGPVDRSYARPEPTCSQSLPRRTASILFTDYAGFSRLTESSYPLFDKEVMGRIAAVLEQHGDKILARNTWGDALYTVMDGAVAGAEIALHLQRALSQADPADLGLAADQGGMRIALHYGSVYESRDRVTGQANFLGNEVARAARIEPVTPPGDVYVTEPFAAMIALHAPDRFRCRYVGQVDLAKKYGAFPMYRLTAAAPAVEAEAASG